MVVGAVLAALLIGFLAGFLCFKVKSRWCPRSGAWTLTSRPDLAGSSSHNSSLVGRV
jgi:hypothetical protein